MLALVAEKTGYPADMLDLDLDLEADLGIDTVKQAELFATIREGTASRATTSSSCATSRPWTTSSRSCSDRTGRRRGRLADVRRRAAGDCRVAEPRGARPQRRRRAGGG